MIYDIIGDIHGQADKLIGLLNQLGYQHNGSCFIPPENHQAFFIGDLIDRGRQEVETLKIVFAMIDAGVAKAVMGNHEYNAIAYATLNTMSDDGTYLRSHTTSNQSQHRAFLDEVAFGSTQHTYWLKRFYELPLWLETEEACFVHACWDEDSMAVLQPCLTDNNCLTPQGLQSTGQRNSAEYLALERVLKGIEISLPNGLFIEDRYGKQRHNVRVKWWLDHLSSQTLHDIACVPASDEVKLKQLPNEKLGDQIDFTLKTDKPIFIGHYWMNGTPEPLSRKVVCTDYSAAVDSGFLTCYQFDTETPLPLSAGNFVQFNHHDH